MVFCLPLGTRFGRASSLLPAEKQAHVWPTLPLQPHSTCNDCTHRRRHSTSRPFKRTLPWTSPVPRLQLIIAMPHLAFTLISVLAHVAGAEEAKLYELMKTEYTDESCEAAGWGPFPNATSTSLTAEAYARAHGASGCKCGMLYGLAHSSLHRAEDVNAASLSSTAQGPARCSGGSAAGFPCENVDLVAHLPLSAFRTNTGEAPAAANDLLP